MAAIPKLIVLAAFDENEDGELRPAFDPLQIDTEDKAKYRARSMAHAHAGVIAWSRTVDVALGDYGDPTVLYQHGKIPDME